LGKEFNTIWHKTEINQLRQKA